VRNKWTQDQHRQNECRHNNNNNNNNNNMDNDKLLNTLLFKTFISHQWGSNLQYNHHILVHSSTSDEYTSGHSTHLFSEY
jgi:hypothetical protein